MSSVQVIIPAYNAAAYIGQTLASVLDQDCPDVEILVLDNASTDATADVVAGYAARRVSYLRNPENIGSIGNHNRGLELATADYVKLLSADDVLLPGVLARQKTALDERPAVGVVTCNCIVTDDALAPTGETTYLPGHWRGADAVAQCARRVANLIGGPSNTMLRRSALRGATFDPTLKWLGDLDFACRVLQGSDFFNIDVNGFLYRRHDATDSLLGCPAPVRLHDEFLFVRKYGGGWPARARIVYRLARQKAAARRAARGTAAH